MNQKLLFSEIQSQMPQFKNVWYLRIYGRSCYPNKTHSPSYYINRVFCDERYIKHTKRLLRYRCKIHRKLWYLRTMDYLFTMFMATVLKLRAGYNLINIRDELSVLKKEF